MPMFASGANVNITGGNPIFNESTGDINIHQNFGGDHSSTFNHDSFNVRDNKWETRNTNKTAHYGNEGEGDEALPKRPQPQWQPHTEPNLKSQPNSATYDPRAASYPGPNMGHLPNQDMSNFQLPSPPAFNYGGGYPNQGRAPMPPYPPQMEAYPYGGQPTNPYKAPHLPQQASYPPHGGYGAYPSPSPPAHGSPPTDSFPRSSGQGSQQQRRSTRLPEQETYDSTDVGADTPVSSGDEEGQRDTRMPAKPKKKKTTKGQGLQGGDRNLSSRMGDLTLESKKASGSRMRAKDSLPATTGSSRHGAQSMDATIKPLSSSQRRAFMTDDDGDETS